MAAKRYRAVFLSPHLDDAVFSCGGTMVKLASEGPVLVLNVFSAYPEDAHQGPVVITRARFEEEARASALLGFATEYLDEVDAALRHPAYRSPGNLFRPPVREDMDRLALTTAKISSFLSMIEFDSIYLPLAIGWHVDHVLSYLATNHWHNRPNTLFYEDAPYCLIPNATQYRLRELGRIPDGQEDSTLARRPFLSEWLRTSRYYAGLAPIQRMAWPVRGGAAVVVALYLRTLLAMHREDGHKGSGAYRLTPVMSGITEQFDRKMDGCYEYGSQISQFFVSRADCVARYRAYSASIGSRPEAGMARPLERFWRFEGAGVEAH